TSAEGGTRQEDRSVEDQYRDHSVRVVRSAELRPGTAGRRVVAGDRGGLARLTVRSSCRRSGGRRPSPEPHGSTLPLRGRGGRRRAGGGHWCPPWRSCVCGTPLR